MHSSRMHTARFLTVVSGGSRIFPGGGANSQKCYYFSIFCRKLHENERIWTPRGGARPWRPPLDPPMVVSEGGSCVPRVGGLPRGVSAGGEGVSCDL